MYLVCKHMAAVSTSMCTHASCRCISWWMLRTQDKANWTSNLCGHVTEMLCYHKMYTYHLYVAVLLHDGLMHGWKFQLAIWWQAGWFVSPSLIVKFQCLPSRAYNIALALLYLTTELTTNCNTAKLLHMHAPCYDPWEKYNATGDYISA